MPTSSQTSKETESMFKLLILLFALPVFADVPISGLPVASPPQVAIDDIFPIVDISANQTQKLKISDILNIPSFSSNFHTYYSSRASNAPPTIAQLNAIFPSNPQAGFIGILNRSNGGTSEYLIWSDGTNWFSVVGVKAL